MANVARQTAFGKQETRKFAIGRRRFQPYQSSASLRILTHAEAPCGRCPAARSHPFSPGVTALKIGPGIDVTILPNTNFRSSSVFENPADRLLQSLTKTRFEGNNEVVAAHGLKRVRIGKWPKAAMASLEVHVRRVENVFVVRAFFGGRVFSNKRDARRRRSNYSPYRDDRLESQVYRHENW